MASLGVMIDKNISFSLVFEAQTSKMENTPSTFSNYTRHFDALEEQTASTLVSILFTLQSLLFFVIGYPILISIIHFEHFGGDPQKRSISNMTFSNVCFFLLSLQTTNMILIGLRTYFGPFHLWAAKIGTAFYMFNLIGFQMSVVFCLFFKNINVLKPSIRLMILDEFWYAFVCISTVLISLIQATQQKGLIYALLNGDSSLIHFSHSIDSIKRLVFQILFSF